MKSNKNKLDNLRKFVDGEVNTSYELIMLLVIIVNIVSLGIDTSRNISPNLKNVLFWIDQVCLSIFVIELILKIIAYNKEFLGEYKVDDEGNETFHINQWNISDFLIVAISIFSSLSCFAVFRAFRIFRSIKDIKMLRSLRIVKSFKLVNKIGNLRSTFKGLLKAIPGIIWTFCFLGVFAYSYAIIGTNVFAEEFPDFFGTLGTSLLSLCQITTLDAWFSQIARPVINAHAWAWIYFISYAFIAASIIMNVIIGIIVDSMAKERERQREKENHCNTVTLSELSERLSELSSQIAEVKMLLEKQNTKA